MKRGITLFCLSLLSFTIHCQEKETADPSAIENYKLSSPYLGLQMGSLGFGAQYAMPLSLRWNGRIAASYFSYSLDNSYTENGAQVTEIYTATVGGVGFLADYSFLKKTPNWKLSTGLFYNFNSVQAITGATASANGETIDAGSLDLQIRTFPVCPYGGLVFGNFKTSKRVMFALELGTFFHGRAKVDWTGEGRIAPTAEQAPLLEENLKYYNWFPYANFQLNFKLKS